MKLTDGHPFKGNAQRRRVIARLVKNSQAKPIRCIRCNYGFCLESESLIAPVCFACLNELSRPLDAKSYRG